MTTYEIAYTIDSQRYPIECARKVLKEAQDYFERLDERKMLPFYADSIAALLCVVDGILLDIPPKLDKSAKELLEHNKLLEMLK